MFINRGAIILKAKQPAIDWINGADEKLNLSHQVTLEEVNQDSMVYLVPEDLQSFEDAQEWAFLNWEALLLEFMNGWYVDETLWPEKRSARLFDKWFDIEYHSMVFDTLGDTAIVRESF